MRDIINTYISYPISQTEHTPYKTSVCFCLIKRISRLSVSLGDKMPYRFSGRLKLFGLLTL